MGTTAAAQQALEHSRRTQHSHSEPILTPTVGTQLVGCARQLQHARVDRAYILFLNKFVTRTCNSRKVGTPYSKACGELCAHRQRQSPCQDEQQAQPSHLRGNGLERPRQQLVAIGKDLCGSNLHKAGEGTSEGGGREGIFDSYRKVP